MPHAHPDRVRIKIDHPNSGNVEAFLNSWSEPFILELEGKDHYTFRSAVSHIQVEILFFASQREAFEYGKKHFDPVTAQHIWGVNGGFLYSLTGADEDLIGNLAGHFAGQE